MEGVTIRELSGVTIIEEAPRHCEAIVRSLRHGELLIYCSRMVAPGKRRCWQHQK